MKTTHEWRVQGDKAVSCLGGFKALLVGALGKLIWTQSCSGWQLNQSYRSSLRRRSQPLWMEQEVAGYCFATAIGSVKALDVLWVMSCSSYWGMHFAVPRACVAPRPSLIKWSGTKRLLKYCCNIRPIGQTCATVLHGAKRGARTEKHDKRTRIEFCYLPLPTTVGTSNH